MSMLLEESYGFGLTDSGVIWRMDLTALSPFSEWKVRATCDPVPMDCNCLASAGAMAKVRSAICVDFLPAGETVMEGMLRVTEFDVTLSMVPVVIPHCESQPRAGGKTLQSQVDFTG
jgi:hypothetical protein